jgi:hypothetical protein
LRRTLNGEVQRFLCRDCGFRYSDKSNIESEMNRGRQLCAILKDAKKLDTAAKIKTVAGEEKLPQDAKGLIAQFLAYLEKEGYSGETQ